MMRDGSNVLIIYTISFFLVDLGLGFKYIRWPHRCTTTWILTVADSTHKGGARFSPFCTQSAPLRLEPKEKTLKRVPKSSSAVLNSI